MFLVDDVFRRKVVASAEGYIGAPYVKVDEKHKDDPRMAELGTTIDPGFNCSGFVIASICRAIGAKPADAWLPDYRTSENMGGGVYGGVELPRLEPAKVKPGDAIWWAEEKNGIGHIALATDTQNDDEIPYVHAVYYNDLTGLGNVCADILRPNGWRFPVHLPLQKLVDIALRSDYIEHKGLRYS